MPLTHYQQLNVALTQGSLTKHPFIEKKRNLKILMDVVKSPHFPNVNVDKQGHASGFI